MTLDHLLDELARDVRAGAAALLGAHLVRGRLRARIVECEAYRGEDDPGSHAFRGPTLRNRSMFGPPGRAYVYFTYGMHWMLNVAAQPEGVGAAVLIRAAEPIEGLDAMRANRPKARNERELLAGPARLCTAFGIDRELDGTPLIAAEGLLRIEPGTESRHVLHGPRIGIAAGKGERHLWRFVDAHALEWVSARKSDLVPLEMPAEQVQPAPTR